MIWGELGNHSEPRFLQRSGGAASVPTSVGVVRVESTPAGETSHHCAWDIVPGTKCNYYYCQHVIFSEPLLVFPKI